MPVSKCQVRLTFLLITCRNSQIQQYIIVYTVCLGTSSACHQHSFVIYEHIFDCTNVDSWQNYFFTIISLDWYELQRNYSHTTFAFSKFLVISESPIANKKCGSLEVNFFTSVREIGRYTSKEFAKQVSRPFLEWFSQEGT